MIPKFHNFWQRAKDAWKYRKYYCEIMPPACMIFAREGITHYDLYDSVSNSLLEKILVFYKADIYLDQDEWWFSWGYHNNIIGKVDREYAMRYTFYYIVLYTHIDNDWYSMNKWAHALASNKNCYYDPTLKQGETS